MSLITWKQDPCKSFKAEDVDPAVTFAILQSQSKPWDCEIKRDKSKGKPKWWPYLKLSTYTKGAAVIINIGASERKSHIERSCKVPKELIQMSMNGTAQMTPEFVADMNLVIQYALAVYEAEIKDIDQ